VLYQAGDAYVTMIVSLGWQEEGQMVETVIDEAELAEAFADIARQLQAQTTREGTWQKIVDLSTARLPEIQHAAISLVHRQQKVDTVAATGKIPEAVDKIQYETGEGPCLSSIWEQDMFVTADLAAEDRWPAFSRRTVAETGIRSMLAFQLFVQEDTLGALNLYNEKPDAFDDRSQAFGRVLAAHAALAMSAANAQEDAEQLQVALGSSREIGIAIGILMCQMKVDQDGAFQILSKGSQRMNVKLRQLAARIVAGENRSNARSA
jgi:transcriptional regulator with GAF, ATPase, and Fis domain